ncbi:MAG: hypothetical protein A6D91_01570 [Bacillaceae bacterium G1]|nr:MAG: hypothetical protein A6D91_01570 [Bacillaceae bacterium G1]
MGTTAGLPIDVDHVIQIELPTPFPVGPVNVYLIQAEKLTLVDTGPNTDQNWQLLNQALAKHGFSIRDIEQIVLTHHHVDHMGMLHRILQVHPVPVYGHPNCRPWLRREPDFFAWHDDFFMSFYREMNVPEALWHHFKGFLQQMEKLAGKTDLTGTLQEGEPIPGMSEWRVVETKGHAQSHIALYRERDGLLVAGDHIIRHISSNAIIEPPLTPGAERAKPLLQYMDNLRKCAAMPVTLTLSGHGEAVDDLPALVDARLAKVEERAEKIKMLLAGGATTAFEVVQALFPGKYKQELGLTVSEVVGHLDVLLERKEIVAEKKGMCITYRPV